MPTAGRPVKAEWIWGVEECALMRSEVCGHQPCFAFWVMEPAGVMLIRAGHAVHKLDLNVHFGSFGSARFLSVQDERVLSSFSISFYTRCPAEQSWP